MTHQAFAFQAIRRDGTRETGVVQAASREAALARLVQKGAFVLRLSEASSGVTPYRPTTADLALGFRGLAALLNAGIPLSRALAILPDLAPDSWKPALPVLRDAIDRGGQLTEAVAAAMPSVPATVVGIIRAGEEAGRLAEAVESAAGQLEARSAIRSTVRGALAYPAMLGVAGTVSTGVLITVVLPRFAALLADAGQALPAATRAMIYLGDIVRTAGLPLVLILCGIIIVIRGSLLDPMRRRRVHALIQSLPIIGPIRRSLATGMVCSTLAALLEGGVRINEALPYAGAAAGDEHTAVLLVRARDRLRRGENVSEALSAEGALTQPALRLLRTGEETGQLALMAAHAGRIETEFATRRMQAAVRLLEPILILGFGGVIAIVAASLLQAMYSLRPSL